MAPTINPIVFSETSLSQYAGYYATVLDDVFTQQECDSLLKHATQSTSWSPAALSAEASSQTVHKNFRNSERIIYIDSDISRQIYERLRPLVEGEIGEIKVGGQWDGITGKHGRKQGPTWKLVGVNPRLSFLRYGPGQYFKPHCDGLNDITLDGGLVTKSFVTLHLYLNGQDGISNPTFELSDAGANKPLEGGSTRFWTPDKKHFIDVVPRVGRVLVFQQRMLVHSGEEVLKGIKYTMRSDFLFEQFV